MCATATHSSPRVAKRGFTLIELSIVLVIIGLITGGVLVGRDLIGAAEIRASISQIEKYNSATNTFRNKYGGLPGDLAAGAQYSFAARGQYAGEGDGNGILEGAFSDAPGMNYGFIATGGETAVFWRDLSDAKLIGASFTLPSETSGANICFGPAVVTCTAPFLDSFIPRSRIGTGYVYVMSANSINYYFISDMLVMVSSGYGKANPIFTTGQAYAIDKKIDDGLPQSGKVIAQQFPGYWASGVGYEGCSYGSCGDPPGTAVAPSSLSCYDSNNSATAPMNYSIGQDKAMDLNCSLAFQFQ